MCVQPLIINRNRSKFHTDGQNMYSQPVPCGKCPKCVKTKISQWSFRIKKERERSTSAYFLTLTYNDENLIYTDSGETTLDKRDFQLFIKRLRHFEKNNKKIKYYAVGEYGTKSGRPHYHAILFNVRDPSNIEKSWDKGFTYAPILDRDNGVTYVLKYISKTRTKISHKNPEFSLMSKRLGENYLTPQMVQWHQQVQNSFIMDNGMKKSMPKYYKEKLYNETQRKEVTDYLKNRAEEKKELKIKQLSKRLKTQDVNVLLNNLESREKHSKFDPRNEVL